MCIILYITHYIIYIHIFVFKINYTGISLCSSLYTGVSAIDYGGLGFCLKYGTWRADLWKGGGRKEAGRKMEEEGRQERKGEKPCMLTLTHTHTSSLERAKPWTHSSTPPQTEAELPQKFLGRAPVASRLGCAPLELSNGHAGPSWGEAQQTLGYPRLPRAPAVNHWDRAPIHHPLLGESLCLSPFYLGSPSQGLTRGPRTQAGAENEGTKRKGRLADLLILQGASAWRSRPRSLPGPIVPSTPISSTAHYTLFQPGCAMKWRKK